jgi:hypothetical protein
MPITINGDTGISSEGLELVGSQTWDNTAISSVDFTHDPTKYTSYFVTWWIDHSPQWTETFVRFINSSGVITSSSYSLTTEWMASGVGSTPNWNVGGYAGDGNRSYIWIAGNGTGFDSQGMCLISIPNYADNYPTVRSVATLVPSTINGDQNNYIEQSGGDLKVAGNTITGFRILGSNGPSNRGTINVMGVKRL